MSTAETVVLRLQNEVSGPADAASGALGRLEAQIAREEGALGRMEAKLGRARAALDVLAAGDASGAVNVEAYNRAANGVAAMGDRAAAQAGKIEALREKLAALAQSAETAAGSVSELGAAEGAAESPMAGVADGANVSSAAMGKLGEATQRLAGPIGEKAGKLRQFGEALAALGPYGVAAAAALIMVIGAIVAVGAAFAFAVTSAGAYRDEMLKLAGATGGSIAAARELQGVITQVASGSALARDKVAGYATQLAQAGLKGAELKSALEAAAIAGSAGGDEMASAFLKSAAAAKAAGQSVDKLSADMKEKLGAIAAAQALSFGVQMSKLKENMAGLFSGVDIEPLLRGMQSVLSIFDQTSATGQSMKASIASVMNAIVGFVLKAATAMVNLYIAVRSNSVVWGALKAAVMGIGIVLGVLAAAFGLVVAAAGVMVAVPAAIIGTLWTVIVKVASAIGGIASGIAGVFSSIGSAISGVVNTLRSVSLADIGSNMIAGLASAIAGAGGAVLNAIMGAVGGAVSAVKSFLGIASPSKLFAEIGSNTAAGMSQGIDSGASDVEASATSLATGAATAATSAPAAASPNGGKTFAPVFMGCTFGSVSRADIEAMMRAIWEAEALDGEEAT